MERLVFLEVSAVSLNKIIILLILMNIFLFLNKLIKILNYKKIKYFTMFSDESKING